MSETDLPEPVDEPGTTSNPTAEPGTAPPAAAAAKPKRRITVRDVVAIVVGVLVIIFIAENGSKTDIRFVGPKVNTYLWLALVIAAAFGFVLGFALAWQRGRKAEKARRN